MRIASLMSVFVRDHFRRADAFGDMLVVSLALIPLDPRVLPYDWAYAATISVAIACILSAIVTVLVTSRAGDTKAEAFILGAGRPGYYLATLLASVLIALFWMAVLTFVVTLLVPGAPLALLRPWAGAVVLNTVVTASLFSFLSILCGRPAGPAVATAVTIIGLSTTWFAGLPSVWLQRLEFLVPPLLQNAKAAAGTGHLLLGRTAVYTVAAVAGGIWRFLTKELRWS